MKKITLQDFWERIKILFIKILSVKCIVFISATVLAHMGMISGWIWFCSALLLVSTRMLEKLITKFPGPSV